MTGGLLSEVKLYRNVAPHSWSLISVVLKHRFHCTSIKKCPTLPVCVLKIIIQLKTRLYIHINGTGTLYKPYQQIMFYFFYWFWVLILVFICTSYIHIRYTYLWLPLLSIELLPYIHTVSRSVCDVCLDCYLERLNRIYMCLQYRADKAKW